MKYNLSKIRFSSLVFTASFLNRVQCLVYRHLLDRVERVYFRLGDEPFDPLCARMEYSSRLCASIDYFELY